ncbi:MAG TPA: bacterial transcriptional activator domain-containing protein, partial [Ilumatobacteraceae bacterium]|nr:bacterial transcriptional activator domain-containing protein [Ilumatobacteraceae bacterium]
RRERDKRLFLSLVDLLAADAEQRGEYDEALRQLDLGIASEPMDESRYVRAGTLLLAQGRRATALEVVRRATAVLDEMGTTPGPDLARLVAELT